MSDISDQPLAHELPPEIIAALSELQSQIWQLRNLIRCVAEAPRKPDDDAALDGLLAYADSIHTDGFDRLCGALMDIAAAQP